MAAGAESTSGAGAAAPPKARAVLVGAPPEWMDGARLDLVDLARSTPDDVLSRLEADPPEVLIIDSNLAPPELSRILEAVGPPGALGQAGRAPAHRAGPADGAWMRGSSTMPTTS